MQINLTPDWSLPVIMVIFMANYLVVRTFFLRPVNDILVSREREARDAERLHEESLGRFEQATREMETKVNEARKSGARMREQQRAEAASHRASVLERTRADADAIVDQADNALRSDISTARERIVADSEELARTAAERLAGRSVR